MALGTWNSVTESALFKMCWDSLQACVKLGGGLSFHFELMLPCFKGVVGNMRAMALKEMLWFRDWDTRTRGLAHDAFHPSFQTRMTKGAEGWDMVAPKNWAHWEGASRTFWSNTMAGTLSGNRATRKEQQTDAKLLRVIQSSEAGPWHCQIFPNGEWNSSPLKRFEGCGRFFVRWAGVWEWSFSPPIDKIVESITKYNNNNSWNWKSY